MVYPVFVFDLFMCICNFQFYCKPKFLGSFLLQWRIKAVAISNKTTRDKFSALKFYTKCLSKVEKFLELLQCLALNVALYTFEPSPLLNICALYSFMKPTEPKRKNRNPAGPGANGSGPGHVVRKRKSPSPAPATVMTDLNNQDGPLPEFACKVCGRFVQILLLTVQWKGCSECWLFSLLCPKS